MKVCKNIALVFWGYYCKLLSKATKNSEPGEQFTGIPSLKIEMKLLSSLRPFIKNSK